MIRITEYWKSNTHQIARKPVIAYKQFMSNRVHYYRPVCSLRFDANGQVMPELGDMGAEFQGAMTQALLGFDGIVKSTGG